MFIKHDIVYILSVSFKNEVIPLADSEGVIEVESPSCIIKKRKNVMNQTKNNRKGKKGEIHLHYIEYMYN